MAKKKPVTQNFGFHLKIYNVHFKPELPPERTNQKWILIPGLFGSVDQAQMHAERTHPGVKNHIEGARVNISIDPAVLAELKATDKPVGKRMVKKESAGIGGLKKNTPKPTKKVVEVIKRTFRHKNADSPSTVKGLKQP